MADWFRKKTREDFAQQKGQRELVESMMLCAAKHRDEGNLDCASYWRNKGLQLALEFDVSADDEMDGRARRMFGALWQRPD
jgi:hypothetical protein